MSKVAEQKELFQSGHRKRMTARMIKHGSESMQDYEVIEMMLFLIFKRKDTRVLAKVLLKKFHGISGILNASYDEIIAVDGLGAKAYEAFQIMKIVVSQILQEKIIDKRAIDCFDEVVSYCKTNMKHLKNEELRVIFLNGAGVIIDDKVVQRGTVDTVEVYSREIIKQCLEFGAKGIILVHNHPSGDPTPSAGDIVCTSKIKEACDVFNISVLDHVIIGGDNYISFRNLCIL